jgi:uncharacterized protein (TIGR03000 family)
VTAKGVVTSRSREEEAFLTPDLQPGRPYSYLFRAELTRDGRTITRTQRVAVRAGQHTEVDFSDLAPGERETARVTVRLPRGATLYVDGLAFTSTGTRTVYETPRLQKGRVYFYTMEARLEGEPGESLKKRIQVEAGKDVTVDFDGLASRQTAQR